MPFTLLLIVGPVGLKLLLKGAMQQCFSLLVCPALLPPCMKGKEVLFFLFSRANSKTCGLCVWSVEYNHASYDNVPLWHQSSSQSLTSWTNENTAPTITRLINHIRNVLIPIYLMCFRVEIYFQFRVSCMVILSDLLLRSTMWKTSMLGLKLKRKSPLMRYLPV